MKLDLMSRNIMILIDECFKESRFIKVDRYKQIDPLHQPDIKNVGQVGYE